MKRKKFISLFSIIILLFSAFAVNSELAKPKYNENPDVSQKIIGSDLITYASKYTPTSIDDVTKFSDLVVIGEILSDGRLEQESISYPSKNPQIDKSENKILTYSTSLFDVKVDTVLYGNVNTDEIILRQLGQPQDDAGETKVKKGDKMLLVLTKHPSNDNSYVTSLYENSLFIIKGNGKVMSLSKDLPIAKYDNINYKTLVKDIEKAKKKDK